jgi:hypothetical protein
MALQVARQTEEETAMGTRTALVIHTVDDVAPLMRAGRRAGVACWSEATVVGMPKWGVFARTWAPATGLTTTAQVYGAFVGDAALAAREAVHLLPPDCVARHVVYDSWRAAPFLESLRRGAFDLALFAAWPTSWVRRAAVVRAAYDGGTTVVRVSGRGGVDRQGERHEGDRGLRLV